MKRKLVGAAGLLVFLVVGPGIAIVGMATDQPWRSDRQTSVPATFVIPADAPRQLTVFTRRSGMEIDRLSAPWVKCSGEGAEVTDLPHTVNVLSSGKRQLLTLEPGQVTVVCEGIEPPAGTVERTAFFRDGYDKIYVVGDHHSPLPWLIAGAVVAIVGVLTLGYAVNEM